MVIPAESQIRKVMELKGYRLYANPEGHDLNIIGIRSKETMANRFDDLLVVLVRRGEQWWSWCAPCATDPGLYWLEHPMSELGCGIIKAGQSIRGRMSWDGIRGVMRPSASGGRLM